MEVFEVHITGDESILKNAKIKTISVELLKPDCSVLRIEHMTSHICKFPSYEECKKFVEDMAKELAELGTKIYRVKIECPYYIHYVAESLYLESHFESKDHQYPISRNINKETILGTHRTYDKGQYDNFLKEYQYGQIELCLYDTDVDEDKDWFDLFQKKS